jgi:hypothetical protein
MAKKTLLEIVQIILSKLDSDEVNSIGDTTESLQVAQEVETTYYDMLSNLEIPQRQKLISFDSVIDVDNKPNYLKVKELVDNFEFLLYNIGTEVAPDYKKMTFVQPSDFLLYVTQNTQGSTTMVVTDPEGAKFPIKTDQHPTYYTTFDDTHLVFDSYNSSVDDTLQESKCIGIAQVIPEFRLEDDYTPELPAKLFPLLIAEASSMCFINHKQAPNSKEEQRARRQLVRHLNNRRRTKDANRPPVDFGRSR